MNVTASCDHHLFASQLASNKKSQWRNGQYILGHMISYLITAGDLFNNYGGSEAVNPPWSHVVLYDDLIV